MNAKRFWYAVFTLLFFAEVAVIYTHADNLVSAPVWFWLLAAFATFRLARLLSFNAVMEPLRAPFVREVEDSSGAGMSTEAKPGFFEGVGELLCCPICTGTHSASLVIGLYAFLPTLGLVFAGVLAVAGLSEQLHWFAEREEWQGRQARELSGTQYLRKVHGSEVNAYNQPHKDLVEELAKHYVV